MPWPAALSLPPHEPRLLSVEVVPVFQGEAVEPLYGRTTGLFPQGAPATEACRSWVEGCARLSAGNPAVQAAWEQAVYDLASLQLLDGPGAEPFMVVAGMPNYTGLFGRDAYVTALQTAALNPATLRGALQVVSRWNAQTTDDRWPTRSLEKSYTSASRRLRLQLGKTPFLYYYGDYSTPGLFLARGGGRPGAHRRHSNSSARCATSCWARSSGWRKTPIARASTRI